jgi:ribonuclease HI
MLPRIDTKKSKLKPIAVQIFPEFDYKLNFDGCSKGNPGLAGAGAVIYNFDKECWSDTFFVGENATNNHAEYAGLILGLRRAKIMGIKCLKVEGDSLLVINQMKGLYKCKSINLLELYEKAKELESHFDIIVYEHVLRNKNKRADELSNIAIDKCLNTKESVTIYDDTCSDDSSK